MPQSLKQAKNQVPLKLTSQYVVDYLANLLLKTAPLNYLGILSSHNHFDYNGYLFIIYQQIYLESLKSFLSPSW